MAEATNPTPAAIKGVSVDHPALVEGIRNCARQGIDKDKAKEIIGVPREVIEKQYRWVAENEKK